MKIFLISLSLFIINISFLSFQGDLSRYIQLRTFLKYQAEEFASGAALYYDEEEYGKGHMVIEQTEALAYMNHVISNLKLSSTIPIDTHVSYEMVILDDEKGYGEGKEVPSVTVTLRMESPDIFRLPFLKVTEIERMARYELLPS